MKDDVSEAFDGSPLRAARKTGREKFHDGERERPFDILDFWQWSFSDLVGNTGRGVVAEYIVAQALGTAKEVRIDWGPYDLTTNNGVKVEVKSSAYVQSWRQKKHSRPEFGIGKRSAWDPETNTFGNEVKRHAQVYVFALLDHKVRETLDPLDITQWKFYVVPTKLLDERHPEQEKIGLTSLQNLAPEAVTFDGLRAAVERVAPVRA